MKNKLKKITDLTINNLLNKDVIMPSIYFEKFNKNAKLLDIDIKDETFQKELNTILIDDFNSIESYMNTIEDGSSKICEAVKNTKKALLNKDIDTLTNIYQQMNMLEKELTTLNKQLFIDPLTNTKNRKWIFTKFLNKSAQFQTKGTCVLINIVDYTYIQAEYGSLLADNLLIFLTNFIKKYLKEEELICQVSRFYDTQFLIFFDEQAEKKILSAIHNIKQQLINTTLKSHSGLLIKAQFEHKIKNYSKNEDSRNILEALFSQSNVA
jgi:GGDEF domain-containing protein